MGRMQTKWVMMRWRRGSETTRRAALAPTFRLGLGASVRDKKSGKKTRLSVLSPGTSHELPAGARPARLGEPELRWGGLDPTSLTSLDGFRMASRMHFEGRMSMTADWDSMGIRRRDHWKSL